MLIDKNNIVLYGNGTFKWSYNSDQLGGRPSPKELRKRENLQWFSDQIEYSLLADKVKLRYDLKKGDIVEIQWGMNVNAEYSGISYGVVVSDSSIFNPLVTVCPIKPLGEIDWKTRGEINIGIIPQISITRKMSVIINQIRTVDKFRIVVPKDNFENKNCLAESEVDNNSLNDTNFINRLDENKTNMILNALFVSLFPQEKHE